MPGMPLPPIKPARHVQDTMGSLRGTLRSHSHMSLLTTQCPTRANRVRHRKKTHLVLLQVMKKTFPIKVF